MLGVRQLDQLLQVGELLDRPRQRIERGALLLEGVLDLLVGERPARPVHRHARLSDRRQRRLDALDQLLLLGIGRRWGGCTDGAGRARRRRGRLAGGFGRRGEARADLLEPFAGVALARGDHRRLEPARQCGRRRSRAGLGLGPGAERERAGVGLRGVLEHGELVLRDQPHHRDRIEQLLARPLERDQRRLRARHAILGGQLLELAPRLGDPGPALHEVEVEVLELDDPALLLLAALVLGLLGDRVDLVGREIADHAGFGDDAALGVREVDQRALPGERIAAARALDLEPRAARLLEHAALLADQPVEPGLELAGAAGQLVADPLDPRLHDREVRRGVGVAGPLAAGVEEPRLGLGGELVGPGQIGVLAGAQLVGVAGARDAEIVGRAELQLGVDAGLAARVEQRLLGGVVVRLGERGDAFIILVARVAVLAGPAAAAGGRDQARDREVHWPRHGVLPTHSAANRKPSAASRNHV
ncbi:MAG: hypothetical protein E6J90_00445 [Deltaproteobacteria bacterium]|nr:MAG: hypothetical protein E6J90_00445 [Deltaproteobacteria bacterium]